MPPLIFWGVPLNVSKKKVHVDPSRYSVTDGTVHGEDVGSITVEGSSMRWFSTKWPTDATGCSDLYTHNNIITSDTVRLRNTCIAVAHPMPWDTA
jgi:hypothetical protein